MKMSKKTHNIAQEKSGPEEISSWLSQNRLFHWSVIVLGYGFDNIFLM
jgi:hypothetical protein